MAARWAGLARDSVVIDAARADSDQALRDEADRHYDVCCFHARLANATAAFRYDSTCRRVAGARLRHLAYRFGASAFDRHAFAVYAAGVAYSFGGYRFGAIAYYDACAADVAYATAAFANAHADRLCGAYFNAA